MFAISVLGKAVLREAIRFSEDIRSRNYPLEHISINHPYNIAESVALALRMSTTKHINISFLTDFLI